MHSLTCSLTLSIWTLGPVILLLIMNIYIINIKPMILLPYLTVTYYNRSINFTLFVMNFRNKYLSHWELNHKLNLTTVGLFIALAIMNHCHWKDKQQWISYKIADIYTIIYTILLPTTCLFKTSPYFWKTPCNSMSTPPSDLEFYCSEGKES